MNMRILFIMILLFISQLSTVAYSDRLYVAVDDQTMFVNQDSILENWTYYTWPGSYQDSWSLIYDRETDSMIITSDGGRLHYTDRSDYNPLSQVYFGVSTDVYEAESDGNGTVIVTYRNDNIRMKESNSSLSTWITPDVETPSTASDFFSVEYFSDYDYWLAFHAYEIYRSDDGGYTFNTTEHDLPAFEYVRDVAYDTDTKTIFAITSSNKVFSSSNQGVNWSLIHTNTGSTRSTQGLAYDDENDILLAVTGGSSQSSISFDGGLTFVDANITWTPTPHRVEYDFRTNSFFVGGSLGVLYRYDIENRSWSNISLSTSEKVEAIFSMPPEHIQTGDMVFSGSVQEGSYYGTVSISTPINGIYDYGSDCSYVYSGVNGSSGLLIGSDIVSSFECSNDGSVFIACDGYDYIEPYNSSMYNFSCYSSTSANTTGNVTITVEHPVSSELFIFLALAGFLFFLSFKIHPAFMVLAGAVMIISPLFVSLEPLIQALVMIIGSGIVLLGAIMSMYR